jgi:hypothetical protein
MSDGYTLAVGDRDAEGTVRAGGGEPGEVTAQARVEDTKSVALAGAFGEAKQRGQRESQFRQHGAAVRLCWLAGGQTVCIRRSPRGGRRYLAAGTAASGAVPALSAADGTIKMAVGGAFRIGAGGTTANPALTEALIAGVHAGKDKARRSGQLAIKVGCNSSPLLGADSTFFADLTRAGGEEFIADLDYIGLDFFPDVFRPVAADRLAAVVQGLLQAHRRDNLAPAGLGRLPLVITEHGWPTGPGRTAQRQAEVLRTVVDVISRNAEELNITGYIHHTLRDARSAGSGLFCQFGLMTDDYTPKPAFHVYRDLIEALSR